MFSDGVFKQQPLHILAVRGPLSRERCLAQGIPCPQIYGDAALLSPELIPKPQAAPTHQYGLVPHFKDADHPLVLRAQLAGWKIISPQMDNAAFVNAISDCEHIASSSLHGLIAAEAYGIPTAWLILSDKVKGGEFKFHDHYAGHDIKTNPIYIREGTDLGAIQFSEKKLKPLHTTLRETMVSFLEHNPLANLLEQESQVTNYLRNTKLTRLLKRKYGINGKHR